MAKVSKADVHRQLRSLLLQADFEVDTERSLRRKLEKSLGASMDGFKAVIKADIDNFLKNQAHDEEEAGAGDEEEGSEEDESGEESEDDADLEADFLSEMDASTKNKRKASSRGASKPAAKKAKKLAVAPTGILGRGKWNEEGEWVSQLNEVKRVTVRNFKGTIFIDVREFYQKSGDWLPGKKGISLRCEEWAVVKPAMDEILGKIQQGISVHVVQITELRRMALREFKGYRLVDIREFYNKDGELLPTKKGISLTGDLFATLAKRRKDVDLAISALGGDPGPEVSAGAEDSPGVPSRQKPVVAASSGGKDNSDEAVVQLSGERLKASVSLLGGKPFLNIRHYYEKDKTWMPAKKGISLTLEQAEILVENVPSITAGLEAGDKSLNVSLSRNRKVTISVFNAKLRVDIREWFTPEKRGAVAQPGQKGVSLTEEQWGTLAQSLDDLMAHAAKLT